MCQRVFAFLAEAGDQFSVGYRQLTTRVDFQGGGGKVGPRARRICLLRIAQRAVERSISGVSKRYRRRELR